LSTGTHRIRRTATLFQKSPLVQNSEGEEKLFIVRENKMKMKIEGNEMKAREQNATWHSVNVFTKASTN
jgi:hypothetical protein